MEEDHEDFKSHSSSFVNASRSSSPPLPSKICGGDDGSGSEGATSVLIDAWGKRFLERENRRHFRLEDWKEIAHTVSNRQLHTGTLEKTSIQCFDRMESLKRQYKEEKQKTGEPSNWLFFDRMDRLLGSRGKKRPNLKQRKSSEGFLPQVKRMRTDRALNLNRNSEAKVGGSSEGKVRNSGDSASELARPVGQYAEEVNMRVEDWKMERVKEMEKQRMEFEKQRMQLWKDTQLEIVKMNKKSKARFSERGQGRRKGYEGPVSELTRAVAGFVEVFERVEKSKLEQVVEMEKHRIEFEKGLELHRIQFLKDAGLEVAQMHRIRKINKPSNQEKQKQGEPEDGTEQELQQEQEQ